MHIPIHKPQFYYSIYSSGFSLVEMAVVLIIVGLLIGGLTVPLTAQIDMRNINKTRESLASINDALIGYAVIHGHLPCPAISAANGSESSRSASGDCNNRSGLLPWAELGIDKLDAWGHLFRYSVTPLFSNNTTLPTLAANGDIIVKTRDTAGSLINYTNTATNLIPAIVISHGKNAAGAFNNDGSQIADTALTNIDEDTNATSSTTFILREESNNTGVTGGEFDDLVSWISPNILLNRMIVAGKLP